jgi:hypothetical protein
MKTKYKANIICTASNVESFPLTNVVLNVFHNIKSNALA